MQQVLDSGAMASPMVGLKGPLMAARTYDAAFPLKYCLKDMRFALEILPDFASTSLRVSSAATASYEDASEVHGESDFAAVLGRVAAPRDGDVYVYVCA